MTKQEQFFYDHAGYSYDPKTQTKEEGREQGAKHLAQAETYAREQGWECSWEYEQERAIDVFGPPDPVNGPFYDPDAEFLCCLLRDENGKVLESLGMIENPSREYRRVVEAELAWEAMPTPTEITAPQASWKEEIARD